MAMDDSDACAGPSEYEAESGANPWPYLKDLFEFKRDRGNSFIMKCMMCLPKETELSAYKNSSSNLRKHVEVSSYYTVAVVCEIGRIFLFSSLIRRNTSVPVIAKTLILLAGNIHWSLYVLAMSGCSDFRPQNHANEV